MANLYLSSGDAITGLNFGGNVFGAAGSESISYAGGVSGIVVDANVEEVRLAGSTSSYTFQQQGTSLVVFSGTTQVAKISLQDDANGTLIAFQNGRVEAKIVAGSPPTITLGTTTVPATAAGAVVPAVIDASAGTGSLALSLTTGTDNLIGTAGDDVFTAGEVAGAATFTVGDVINGGAGNDTLNWVQAAAITTLPAGSSVTSIETLNATSGAAITLNTTSSFAGLTALNANTTGFAQTLTAAATTNVTATNTLQAATAVSVTGGNNVAVNATGVTTGTTTVAGAAGTVAVTSAGAALADAAGATTATQGAISVTGGTKVNVTSTGSVSGGSENALDALTLGAVTVTGTGATTEVNVTQTAAQAQATNVVGTDGKAAIVGGAVTVTDVNSASTTAAGTIATVSVNNAGAVTVNSGALKTLNLSGKITSVDASTLGALTTAANTALALNTNGLTTTGAVTVDTDITTLNVTGSTAASTIASLVGAGVKTLNVAGDAKVSLTAQTLAALTDVVVTNTAGVKLGSALAVGTNFTGGAGADEITLGATTKAINMGAGDDVVTLNSATLGAGGTLNGGDGRDTLVANTNGSAFIADPAFGGFEVLRVAGAAAQGSHNANGFTALELGATAAGVTFTSVAAGTGLTILAAPTGNTVVTLANATGTADVFNLTLSSSAALVAGSVSLAGVETINITNTDTNTTAQTNSITLVDAAAKSVVVTGNAGLTVTNDAGNTAITNFDASGVSGTEANAAALGVTFTSVNATVGENVTIKGGSGNDVLTGTATANDTIIGGAGADTLVYTGGTDTFTGGTGADTFDINALGTKTSFVTITDFTKGDKIDVAGIDTLAVANAALGAKVTLGAGATFDQYLDAAAAGDGAAVAAQAKWFTFGSDTYLVIDNTAGGTFAATDSVIKLTGTLDLSTSAFAASILTFA
ncbi:S-layer protein [Novosphingobium sp. JCM 18896]|uniref:beta strand repeat-containing protein n=1 Tax=Novosphingobium sp. JCM 18896 TaxID=2989731 RepID=UPI0029CA3F59|nr:S-layer protein [Novosphingobium sp. JCM 18896]